MNHLFHRKKNGGSSSSATQDVEASAADAPVPGAEIGNEDTGEKLSEYSALDRYISNYRDDRSRADEEEGEAQKKRPKWWQFWKTSSKPAQYNEPTPPKVPEEWLDEDIQTGISSSMVAERRKVCGWNELTAEKENIFVKVLSYFRGPILYGKRTIVRFVIQLHTF